MDPAAPEPAAIARAAEVLRGGGLVAFPTETVYGLGANALSEAAVARIFAAKGRPAYNPLIVHVTGTGAARKLVESWPAAAECLASAFWPGPLTIVLRKRASVPDLVTAGLATVAIRAPAHPVARALLEAADLPIAAPSANRFTEVSPTTAEHVHRSLGERVDLVLDGGPTPVGIESTVLDLSGGQPVLLRPGSVTREQIERTIGPLAAVSETFTGAASRPSPGMTGRHYAPRAELRLFEASDIGEAAAAAAHAHQQGKRVAALLLSAAELPADRTLRLPDDPQAYAQRLYAALHELDAWESDLILAERVPNTAEWEGVRDRLERAARQ